MIHSLDQALVALSYCILLYHMSYYYILLYYYHSLFALWSFQPFRILSSSPKTCFSQKWLNWVATKNQNNYFQNATTFCRRDDVWSTRQNVTTPSAKSNVDDFATTPSSTASPSASGQLIHIFVDPIITKHQLLELPWNLWKFLLVAGVNYSSGVVNGIVQAALWNHCLWCTKPLESWSLLSADLGNSSRFWPCTLGA